MDKIGLAGAAKVFDAALQLDPGSAYRWIDSGEARLKTGNPGAAELCYLRAGELAPNDVRILLDIGDYYEITGKTDQALRAFSEILRQTVAPPQDILTCIVFGYYPSMNVIRNHLLDQAIPDTPNTAAFLQYLQHTIRNGDAEPVRQVWDWACGKGFDTDSMALDYTGFMFGKQQYEAAGEGWAKHFARRNDGYPQSSRIFNGGFEYEITSGAFDWQFEGPDSVKAARDRLIRQAGDYSYRIDFSGNNNLNYHHLRQTVYAHPGKYRFEAWMRTSKITSDEGIRFRLRTSRDNSNFAVETPALTGTSDWTRLEADIEVPPGNPLLEVALARRNPSTSNRQSTVRHGLDRLDNAHTALIQRSVSDGASRETLIQISGSDANRDTNIRKRCKSRYNYRMKAIAFLLLSIPLAAQTRHVLQATPQNIVIGYYDASTPPALRIHSGEIVEIHTLGVGTPTALANAGLPQDKIVPALLEVVKAQQNGRGHFLTGPIFIEGAEPGDALEVDIRSIDLAVDYAYNGMGANGTLHDEFPQGGRKNYPALDRKRMRCSLCARG